MNFVFDFLKKHDVEYKRNYELKNISSINIGGSTEALIFPNDLQQLVSLTALLYESAIPYKVVGRASNILFPDREYHAMVISTKKLRNVEFSNNFAIAECGTSLTYLINCAKHHNLGGMETLFGIPGSVGGAIFSNAGAHGSEISNFLCEARVFSPKENREMRLCGEDFRFTYRKSILSECDYILLSATLNFVPKSSRETEEGIKRFMDLRRKSQPIDSPSLGSIFKKNGNIAVSALIDALGLKGLSVGDAVISKKHAGFIINRGEARSEDVLELIKIIKCEIQSNYGFIPEEEIEILT